MGAEMSRRKRPPSVYEEKENRQIRKAANRLATLTVQFRRHMEAKLLLKQREGKGGWGNIRHRAFLKQELLLHVHRALESGKGEDYVDVANYAAFLWSMARKNEYKGG